MSKKHLVFIILLTVIAVFIWITGEIGIIMFAESGRTLSVIWTVLMVVLTLSISVWQGLKCDRDKCDKSDKNNRNW